MSRPKTNKIVPPPLTLEQVRDELKDEINKTKLEFRRDFQDIHESNDIFEDQLKDLYKVLGTNASEVHLLALSIDKAAGKIKDQTNKFSEVATDLQNDISGSTRVIIKEVDKPKKRWYQLWKKKKGGDN